MISNANKKYGGKTKVIIVILFNYQIITSISKQQLSWLAGLPPKALVAGSITDMALRCSFLGFPKKEALWAAAGSGELGTRQQGDACGALATRSRGLVSRRAAAG